MKIQFETEDELIAFVKASALPWNERLSPVAAVEFALSEMDEFEFMRNDLLLRLETQISRLTDTHERMTKNLREYEQEQKEIKEQDRKNLEAATNVDQTQASP